jgi:hypothetical protein
MLKLRDIAYKQRERGLRYSMQTIDVLELLQLFAIRNETHNRQLNCKHSFQTK